MYNFSWPAFRWKLLRTGICFRASVHILAAPQGFSQRNGDPETSLIVRIEYESNIYQNLSENKITLPDINPNISCSNRPGFRTNS